MTRVFISYSESLYKKQINKVKTGLNVIQENKTQAGILLILNSMNDLVISLFLKGEFTP